MPQPDTAQISANTTAVEYLNHATRLLKAHGRGPHVEPKSDCETCARLEEAQAHIRASLSAIDRGLIQ